LRGQTEENGARRGRKLWKVAEGVVRRAIHRSATARSAPDACARARTRRAPRPSARFHHMNIARRAWSGPAAPRPSVQFHPAQQLVEPGVGTERYEQWKPLHLGQDRAPLPESIVQPRKSRISLAQAGMDAGE